MKRKHLRGRVIDPGPILASTSITHLVDRTFEAYNAARLREACHLFVKKMLAEDVTVGLSLSGALTPAGLGISCLIPLIENGFVDWIVSTGANLYHDTHFAMGLPLYRGASQVNDVDLRNQGVVRIYDIFLESSVLLSTDQFFYQVISAAEFQKEMSTAEFHHRVGKYVAERERLLGREGQSLLAAAYHHGLPIFTSSPGDSAIGMNIAAKAMDGNGLKLDVSRDVNETTAIVLAASREGKRNAALILGGGSPKNFLLQTEPQIQEVLGIREKGFDYFLQVTGGRADTGGLSGATPGEAVSWGKVDPDRLPDAVVCYLDSTVALPIMTAYALANHGPRPTKRLYERLPEFTDHLLQQFAEAKEEGRSDMTESPGQQFAPTNLLSPSEQVASTALHSFGCNSATLRKMPIPALLTRMSSLPKDSTAHPTRASTWSASRTSQRHPTTRAPSGLTSEFTVWSMSAWFRELTTT